VSVIGAPDSEGIPLLAGRNTPSAPLAVFVCRGFVCQAPTTDPLVVGEAVRARNGI